MKEIGIRKVLGATATNIVSLLSVDFVKLVVLANLLAWPVAWFYDNVRLTPLLVIASVLLGAAAVLLLHGPRRALRVGVAAH